MRQSRLATQSKKRAAEQRRRRKVLARDHGPQRCQYPPGCADAACDAHEVQTRARGGSISDPGNIVLLCRRHHDGVGRGEPWAYDMGLLARSWDAHQ